MAAVIGNRLRYLDVGRGVWGVTLLAAPEAVLHAVGAHVDHAGIVAARVLGARHLVQSATSGLHPSPEVLAAGVSVDTMHSLTALALASADARRARGGIVDAAVAATWAVAGIYDLTHRVTSPPCHQRFLDRIALGVLAVLPGGRALLRLARRA